MKSVFNFSAGPAMLPKEVLQQAKLELHNWHGLNISVMEISHRSEEFIQLAVQFEQDLRDLLSIPNHYKVLLCHGGARAQFSAIPMNMIRTSRSCVDYMNGGYWSLSAAQEAQKYCHTNIIDISMKKNGVRGIKCMYDWSISKNSIYIHYCLNETIDGITINELPDFNNRIIAVDCSSILLSKPCNINKYGIIYASAQKNIGPSGVTIVIIREDLIHRCAHKSLPTILNYQVLAKNNSMVNTPTTFTWYLSGLVLKWLKKQGGLEKINDINQIKSNLLYNTIDENDFYYNDIFSDNRSCTNIPFKLKDKHLEELFIKEATSIGLYSLRGHRAVGGIRASLYNAMPLEGVKKLVTFMKEFAHQYG